MFARYCLGCGWTIRSGSYCIPCARTVKAARKADSDTARRVREADPVCRCTARHRWHIDRTECGATEDLTADHVWPFSFGGASVRQTLCRRCNAAKGKRPLGR